AGFGAGLCVHQGCLPRCGFAVAVGAGGGADRAGLAGGGADRPGQPADGAGRRAEAALGLMARVMAACWPDASRLRATVFEIITGCLPWMPGLSPGPGIGCRNLCCESPNCACP